MKGDVTSVMDILEDLKVYVQIKKFPSIKSAKLVYRIPDFIGKIHLSLYLSTQYNLNRNEQNFLIDNLLDCAAVQPKDYHVIIGSSVTNVSPIVVNDSDYGEFHIYGTRAIQCTDTHDINATLTSYICAHGITAFVHKYKHHNAYRTSVYFSSNFDKLLKYVILRVDKTLYSEYITTNNDRLEKYNNGDYHETYST